MGQYTAKWLLENSNAELLLWLRTPKNLTAIPENHPRVKLLVGDLREPRKFANDLYKVNRVIHTATAWGDVTRTHQVNVLAVEAFLKLLNPEEIKQIIYFSTASILDRNLQPLPESLIYGTEYIQTKAICLKELEKSPLAEKIIAVFPTLVFGGKVDQTSLFPTSYLTAGLSQASQWLWLARWFKAYSRFHFIHAADIAQVCGLIATNPHIQIKTFGDSSITRIVLAQPFISIDEAVDTLCAWKGLSRVPRIPLWNWLVKVLIKILPIQLSPWDLFSIKQRHFIHAPITNPEHFGGKSHAATLKEVLQDSGLPKTKNPPRELNYLKTSRNS